MENGEILAAQTLVKIMNEAKKLCVDAKSHAETRRALENATGNALVLLLSLFNEKSEVSNYKNYDQLSNKEKGTLIKCQSALLNV